MALTAWQEANLPSWVTDHKSWDQIALGGSLLPGISHIPEVSRALRFDKGQARGTANGAIGVTGLEISDFTIELVLPDREAERRWNITGPELMPIVTKKGTQQHAWKVDHPSLARLGISHCVITKITEVPPKAGGVLLVRIHCSSAKEAVDVEAHRPKQAKAVPQRQGGLSAGPAAPQLNRAYSDNRTAAREQSRRETAAGIKAGR